jgi:uncharacterized BrkB/YihY/UPF0761 family membrane protein
MKRYDAAMGCCLALLLMATAFLYPLWLLWIGAAVTLNEQNGQDGPRYLMYILEVLPTLLLVFLWALFLWAARRKRPPSDAPTQ